MTVEVFSASKKRVIESLFIHKQPLTIREIVRTIKHAKELQLPISGEGWVSFPERGPFDLDDEVGMVEAILTLRRSLDSGRYQEHIQFDTARKIRVGFSSYWHASSELSNTAFLDSTEMVLNALTLMSVLLKMTVLLMPNVQIISARIHVNVTKDIKVMVTTAMI